MSFHKEPIRIGRRSSTSMSLSSEELIKKYQNVADTISDLGLDQAILQAFSDNHDAPTPIKERVEQLEVALIDIDKDVTSKLNHLYRENKQLKMLVNELIERITQLEEPPKRKGLFKQKN